MEARYLPRVVNRVFNTWTAVASTVLTNDEVSRWWFICKGLNKGFQREDCESGTHRWTVDISDWPVQHWMSGAIAPPVAPDLSGPEGAAAYTEASGCWLQVIGQLKSCDVEMQKKMFQFYFYDTFLYGNVGDASKWERKSFLATFKSFWEILAFPLPVFILLFGFCTLPRVIILVTCTTAWQTGINMAVSLQAYTLVIYFYWL